MSSRLDSRFIIGEVPPHKLRTVRGMLGRLDNLITEHRSLSQSATALVAASIAVSQYEPQTIEGVKEQVGYSSAQIKNTSAALHKVGLIDRSSRPDLDKQDREEEGYKGRPRLRLEGHDELYIAMSLRPDWQAAARACTLAAYLDVSVHEAYAAGVDYYCQILGLGTGTNGNGRH